MHFMNIKKELFHFLLRLGKRQSRNITNILRGLSGQALIEHRHKFIQMMRVKSRTFSKIFHHVAGSVPKGILTEYTNLGGIEGLKISPPQPSKKVIFYLHGGGFVLGLQDTLHHHGYLPHLANSTNATIYEIDYRVAPEHPFPAAVDDVLTGYEGLLALGIAPHNIVVMGDSAGGTLTLSLLLKLKDLGLPMPSGSITMSPATAPVTSVDSFRTREELDIMFTPEMLSEVYTPAYTVMEHYESPYLHPLYGEYEGLPPMLVIVGGCDMLHDHGVLVAQKAKLAGVDVTLDVDDKMIHAYPVLYDLYDEAKVAMDKVVAFIERVALPGQAQIAK
jgi:epsilon-lactone hydrolase